MRLRLTSELPALIVESEMQPRPRMRAVESRGASDDADRIDRSPRQNAGALSDPAEMAEWTEYFRTHHGMSDALVLLTAPIEIPDWEAPEGGQFVYSLRDGKIYLADVEDLPDPSRIVAQAQPGVSMWPSFGAFLFWYLGGY